MTRGNCDGVLQWWPAGREFKVKKSIVTEDSAAWQRVLLPTVHGISSSAGVTRTISTAAAKTTNMYLIGLCTRAPRQPIRCGVCPSRCTGVYRCEIFAVTE